MGGVADRELIRGRRYSAHVQFKSDSDGFMLKKKKKVIHSLHKMQMKKLVCSAGGVSANI